MLDDADTTKDLGRQEAYAGHFDMRYHTDLAKNPYLHPSVQELLADENDAFVTRHLMEREDLTLRTLHILVEKGHWSTVVKILGREDLTSETQALAAQSNVPRVRWAICDSRVVHSETLMVAARTWDETLLREFVRSRPDVWETLDAPVSTLKKYGPQILNKLLAEADRETTLALAATWNGTVRDLLEASMLTQR